MHLHRRSCLEATRAAFPPVPPVRPIHTICIRGSPGFRDSRPPPHAMPCHDPDHESVICLDELSRPDETRPVASHAGWSSPATLTALLRRIAYLKPLLRPQVERIPTPPRQRAEGWGNVFSLAGDPFRLSTVGRIPRILPDVLFVSVRLTAATSASPPATKLALGIGRWPLFSSSTTYDAPKHHNNFMIRSCSLPDANIIWSRAPESCLRRPRMAHLLEAKVIGRPGRPAPKHKQPPGSQPEGPRHVAAADDRG